MPSRQQGRESGCVAGPAVMHGSALEYRQDAEGVHRDLAALTEAKTGTMMQAIKISIFIVFSFELNDVFPGISYGPRPIAMRNSRMCGYIRRAPFLLRV